jgi:hypothetical protein
MLGAPVPGKAVPDEPIPSLADLIPKRKFQELPGKVVGVLVSDVAAVMGADGRSGPPDALGFSRDRQSYRWIYVVDEQTPLITNLQVEVGTDKERAKAIYPSLSMANAKQVQRWKIKAQYSLVEVEVNDRKGSPSGEAFVATQMKVLDGSQQYGLVVERAIADARDRYALFEKDQAQEHQAAMLKVQKAALKEKKPTGPRTKTTLLYLTWLSEKNLLEISFVTSLRDGAFETRILEGDGGRPRPLPLPPRPPARPEEFQDNALIPPPPPPPFRQEITTGTAFGIDYARVYQYSQQGKLVGTRTAAATSFQQELNAPPGPRQ